MWPQGVCWLNHETGVREARGGRVQNPETAAADAVAEHLRERSREPVQTDLAKRGLAVGRRPPVVGPCAPEAEAANDPVIADVDGHWHRFRLGVDQPDYVRLLRCFASFARAALHASVTRRATSYGSHPQSVSIQSRGDEGRRCRSASISASPRGRSPIHPSRFERLRAVGRRPRWTPRLAVAAAHPCGNGEESPARQSTLGKHPNV